MVEHTPIAREFVELLERTDYAPEFLLGRGGVGEVYAVRHRFFGRPLAMKVLTPHAASDAQWTARLRVEAQALAQLQHPNVVDIIDFLTLADGRTAFVMERLEGSNLAQALIKQRCLSIPAALDVALWVLRALGTAHAAGLIHRDVKPENIFLHEPPGGPRVIKVLDFGVARVLADGAARDLALEVPTNTGALVGSPRFMSPEAAQGLKVDARADLYSLALVLFVSIVGHGPFDCGETRLEPPSSFVRGPSPELDRVLLWALEPNPDRRPSTALEFATALAQVPERHATLS